MDFNGSDSLLNSSKLYGMMLSYPFLSDSSKVSIDNDFNSLINSLVTLRKWQMNKNGFVKIDTSASMKNIREINNKYGLLRDDVIEDFNKKPDKKRAEFLDNILKSLGVIK